MRNFTKDKGRLLMKRDNSHSRMTHLCRSITSSGFLTLPDTVRSCHWCYIITFMLEAHTKRRTQVSELLSLFFVRRTPTTKNDPERRNQRSIAGKKKHSTSLCQVPSCLISGPSLESVPSVRVCVSVCVVQYRCVCLKVAEKVRRCPWWCVRGVYQYWNGPCVFVCVCVVCDQLSFIAVLYHWECHLATVSVCLCVWLCQQLKHGNIPQFTTSNT